MSFLSNIFDAVKRKSEELKERREFLNMVETKAKPIRRAAYMKQMLHEVIAEGKEKAKADVAKKIPQKPKTESDFGLAAGLNDPMKFINQSELNKERKK